MNSYLFFNGKVLSTIGTSLVETPKRFERVLQVLTATLVAVETFQTFMFLLTSNEFSSKVSTALTVNFCCVAVLSKYLTVVWQKEKLRSVQKDLMERAAQVVHNENELAFKDLKFCSKLSRFIVVQGVSCIWIVNLLALIKPIIDYITVGAVTEFSIGVSIFKG